MGSGWRKLYIRLFHHFTHVISKRSLGKCKGPWIGIGLTTSGWLHSLFKHLKGYGLWALVRKDPTCRGATKPVRHNYWACALDPANHNYWAHVPQLLKPTRLGPMLHNTRSHHSEKPAYLKEEQPPLAATRESLHAATKTQRSHK